MFLCSIAFLSFSFWIATHCLALRAIICLLVNLGLGLGLGWAGMGLGLGLD